MDMHRLRKKSVKPSRFICMDMHTVCVRCELDVRINIGDVLNLACTSYLLFSSEMYQINI